MRIMEPGFEEPNDRNRRPQESNLTPRNSVTRRVKMVVVTDEEAGSRLLYGETEETFINENKGVDVVTTVEIGMLDCGHVWDKVTPLYRCWNNHLVCEKHAHRCPSGRVVCEVPGCGKLFYDTWYSTFSKYLLDSTIGCRGLGKVRGREVRIRKQNLLDYKNGRNY